MAKAPVSRLANASPSSRYKPGMTATSVACCTGRPRSSSQRRNSRWLSISPLQTATTPLAASTIGWWPSVHAADGQAGRAQHGGFRSGDAGVVRAAMRERLQHRVRPEPDGFRLAQSETLTMPQMPHIAKNLGRRQKNANINRRQLLDDRSACRRRSPQAGPGPAAGPAETPDASARPANGRIRTPRTRLVGHGFSDLQAEEDVIARQLAAVLRDQGGRATQIKCQPARKTFQTGQLRLRRQRGQSRCASVLRRLGVENHVRASGNSRSPTATEKGRNQARQSFTLRPEACQQRK